MKSLFLLLTLALLMAYPGTAISQNTGKAQPEKPPAQAQAESKAPMMCPMMVKGKMPPDMEKKMQEHMAQAMKGPLEKMQKQIDELGKRLEALEKKK
jgi:hypothetical protein